MAAKKIKREEVFVEEEEEMLGGGAAAAGAKRMPPFYQYMSAMTRNRRSGWRIAGYVLLGLLLFAVISPLSVGILGIFTGGALGALVGLSILVLAIWKLIDLAKG